MTTETRRIAQLEATLRAIMQDAECGAGLDEDNMRQYLHDIEKAARFVLTGKDRQP